jgi:hypothetical protein
LKEVFFAMKSIRRFDSFRRCILIQRPPPPPTPQYSGLYSKRYYKILGAVLVGGGGIYYCAHLERVPVSGRLRFNDTTPKRISKMTQPAFQKWLEKYQGQILPRDHPSAIYVEKIAQRLLFCVDDQESFKEMEVFVVDLPIPNAFVLPGIIDLVLSF